MVTPYVSRIVRSSLLEVLDSDYVELARLKGVPEKVVMRKHALLNAIVPGIQVIALQLAWLAGGVVFVEYLFSYPGIGASLVDSVRNSDFPMVQVLAMVIAAVYVGRQPDRRHPVHPLHPASEDGDRVMSVVAVRRTCSASGSQRRLVTGLVITLLIMLHGHLRPAVRALRRERDRRQAVHDGGLLARHRLPRPGRAGAGVLYGGASILIISLLATALGMVLGIIIGVVAAYWGGWLDEAIMRLNDVALAFPQILLVLLVLTAVDQPSWWMIVLLVGASHAPRVARLARGVALGIVSRDYVTAAEALGESRLRVILAEVLPNMNAPLLAEAGLRLTYSIGLVAGVGFLGFAANPNAAEWGQMIYENRLALLVQPWGIWRP